MREIVLVVSGYAADLSWLERVEIPHVLYHKGDSPPDRAILLPNVGRESHTYLHHIVERYGELPEWTAFSQDNPFPHTHDFVDRLHALREGPLARGFTNLCSGVVTEDGDGSPNHSGLKLSEHYRVLFGEERSSFTFGPGAQFIVEREAILDRDVDFYRRALDLVLTAPQGPWVLERFWPYLFGSDGAR